MDLCGWTKEILFHQDLIVRVLFVCLCVCRIFHFAEIFNRTIVFICYGIFELTAFKLRGRAANYDENPLINKVGPWRNHHLEGHGLCEQRL